MLEEIITATLTVLTESTNILRSLLSHVIFVNILSRDSLREHENVKESCIGLLVEQV